MITMLIVLTIGMLGAQEMNFPVAGTDNFFAPLVNPSAISVGNANGFAYLGHFDSEGKAIEDQYSLFFNFKNSAYVMNKIGDDYFHTAALSSEIVKNLYLGGSFFWKAKHFKKLNWSEGLLYRPANYFSLGIVGYNLFEDEEYFRFGSSVRPLAFSNDLMSRFTVSTDVSYISDEWQKPVLGVQTEIFNGIQLGGSYDMNDESIGFNFALNFNNFSIGSTGGYNSDNEFGGGSWYTNISGGKFRSILNPKKQNKFYDYKISGNIVEKNQAMNIGPFRIVMGKNRSLQQVLKEIEELTDNEEIKGIVFKSGNFGTSFANFKEIKDALTDFRAAGKKVIYYSENIGNINYVFAAGVADEIYLNPLGSLDLKGIAVNAPYFKGLLDTLGVDFVNFRSHEFKTAGNMLSETEMTSSERESYDYLLEGLYVEMLAMIEEGRGTKLKKPVRDLVDEGPYWNPDVAYDNGLIDGIIYEDELEAKIEGMYGKSNVVTKYKTESVTYDWHKKTKDKIALIYAVGSIISGSGQEGKTIGSVTTGKAIKDAREDKSIKGILIRVDSGGGSALASDIIAREVELCNSGENKKPVVVSMGGTAASGGYYIAAKSDMVIAQPTTVTGSIGVVGLFPQMERMYEKLHINWSTVKKGEHSDFGATHRFITEEERHIAEESIENIYWKFIDVVAKGRNMTRDEVHEVAKGRVWTGQQAFDRGLVDKLGGMDTALTELKKLAKIERETAFVEFTGQKGDLKEVGISFKTKSMFELPSELETLRVAYEKLTLFGDEKVLMVMPTEIEIK